MPELQILYAGPQDTQSTSARLSLPSDLSRSEDSRLDDESWIMRWNQDISAKHHPLLKTMAQVIFGMHLLYEGKTGPGIKVVNAIKSHVAIIDDFLDETVDVLGSASEEITRDVHAFQLLINEQDSTQKMACCMANFRETVQHTKLLSNAVMHDTDELASANRYLHQYILRVKRDWPRKTSEQFACFVAIRGNKDGWDRYICQVRVDVEKLSKAVAQLQSLVDTWRGKLIGQA